MYFLGAYKDGDGTLFFSTNTAGFYFFNPRELIDNDFIPPVYITGLNVMNKPVYPADPDSILQLPIEFTKEINLSYRQNILSFSFAALNYFHPEKNQYAYRLVGYDKDWIYTDALRRYANYTNLDPGDYTFKVKASNNDGKWNEIPTVLKIVITPPFWKTSWFRILIFIGVVIALYLFYRYRVGQIILLQRIRNKIAADLHDDIGSTLNSISVFSEVARRDDSKRDRALVMIGESSRKIIESMSDIVWSINPENDSFDKIIFRMRSLSYNLLKIKRIECAFNADESLSGLKLPMEIRRNFYLIFKEALNNLVKYSQALHASIIISREHSSISCIVRDDGIGFDSSREHEGNGLGNMRKRAREIGAILEIESVIGKGTSIELNLRV
jgi:two-component sensor histidine kinase